MIHQNYYIMMFYSREFYFTTSVSLTSSFEKELVISLLVYCWLRFSLTFIELAVRASHNSELLFVWQSKFASVWSNLVSYEMFLVNEDFGVSSHAALCSFNSFLFGCNLLQ